MAATAAVPTHTHPLACYPTGHARTDLINHSGNFMSRNTWVLDARPMSFFCKRIAVTDAARLHTNTNLTHSGLRNLPLNQFYRPTGTAKPVLPSSWP